MQHFLVQMVLSVPLAKGNKKVEEKTKSSYMGFSQLALGSKQPPHLKAMSVVSGFSWMWDNCIYKKGVFELVFVLLFSVVNNK